MARKPRLHLVGGLYHVMLRGNNGKNIFFDNVDREYLEKLIIEGVKRFGHQILAYCWMNNHIHLAIEVNKIPLSKIIQNISFRYTRYINKKKKQFGHLFQGRYKAILVEKNSWIKSDKILSMFSKNRKVALKKYLQFLKEGADCATNFEVGMQDSRIIGNEEFIEKQVLNRDEHISTMALPTIIKSACKILNISKSKLYEKTRNRQVTFARHVIGYLNKHNGKSTMQSLANQFSLDLSTLSRSITNFENKIEEPFNSKLIKEIKAEMQARP